jgi:hypothetical protein
MFASRRSRRVNLLIIIIVLFLLHLLPAVGSRRLEASSPTPSVRSATAAAVSPSSSWRRVRLEATAAAVDGGAYWTGTIGTRWNTAAGGGRTLEELLLMKYNDG